MNSRRKGAAGEREVAHILQDHGFPGAERNLEQSRDGGGDILIGGYVFEVKRRARLAESAWREQVRKAAHTHNAKPVLVTRANNGDWWASVPLLDFLAEHMTTDNYLRAVAEDSRWVPNQ